MTSGSLRRWFLSLRAYSFTASLMPAALAAALSLSLAQQVLPEPSSATLSLLWWPFPVYVFAALLFHAGTNVLNDYYDYCHGVDTEDDGDPTRVLTRGLVSPAFMLWSGRLYFVLGVLIGSTIGLVRGPVYVVLGILGATGAYFYTNARFSFKYVALGDVVVFLLMGPALVAMGVWGVAGVVPASVVAHTLPVAFLVTAILHGNNLRDREGDRAAGVRTLANRMSHAAARWFFAALVTLPYLMVLLMVHGATLPPLTLITLASAPIAFRLARSVFDSAADLSRLPLSCALLHLVFSAAYTAGIAVAAL